MTNVDDIQDFQLTDEEILAINAQSAKIDSIIVAIVFIISLVLGGFYAATYEAAPSEVIRSAERLQALDFIADYTYLNAEISQDAPGEELVALRDGIEVGSFSPFDGSDLTLVIKERADGSFDYSLTYSEAD